MTRKSLLNAKKLVKETDEMIKRSRSLKRNTTGATLIEGRQYLKSPPSFKRLAFLRRPGTPKFSSLKTMEKKLRNTSLDFGRMRKDNSLRKYRRNGKLHILISKYLQICYDFSEKF